MRPTFTRCYRAVGHVGFDVVAMTPDLVAMTPDLAAMSPDLAAMTLDLAVMTPDLAAMSDRQIVVARRAAPS